MRSTLREHHLNLTVETWWSVFVYKHKQNPKAGGGSNIRCIHWTDTQSLATLIAQIKPLLSIHLIFIHDSSPIQLMTTTLHTRHLLFVLSGTLLLGGCNLGINVEDYPYTLTIVEDATEDIPEKPDLVDIPKDIPKDETPDLVEDMPDMEKDIPEDIPKVGVKLIFTEVMIQSKKRDSNEYGEYVEVVNIGDTDADATKIVIRLDTANGKDIKVRLPPSNDPDEQGQFKNLKPIKPGEHFVFVRQDDSNYGVLNAAGVGQGYEWRWTDRTIALTNSGPRKLTLIYDVAIQDVVGWTEGKWAGDGDMPPSTTLLVEEGVSITLDANSYTAEGNNDPAAWCAADTVFGNDRHLGSPGGASRCPATNQ